MSGDVFFNVGENVTGVNICVLLLTRHTSILLVYFPSVQSYALLLSFLVFPDLLGGVSILIQWNEFLHIMSM